MQLEHLSFVGFLQSKLKINSHLVFGEIELVLITRKILFLT